MQADQKRLSLRLTANLLLDPAAGRPAPDKLSLGLDAGSGLEAPASSPGAFSTMLQAWMAARSIPVEAHAVGELCHQGRLAALLPLLCKFVGNLHPLSCLQQHQPQPHDQAAQRRLLLVSVCSSCRPAGHSRVLGEAPCEEAPRASRAQLAGCAGRPVPGGATRGAQPTPALLPSHCPSRQPAEQVSHPVPATLQDA